MGAFSSIKEMLELQCISDMEPKNINEFFCKQNDEIKRLQTELKEAQNSLQLQKAKIHSTNVCDYCFHSGATCVDCVDYDFFIGRELSAV